MTPQLPFAIRGADITPDGLYRYRLWRQWHASPTRACLFIMLNPSTADGIEDDPTIRRCVDFARGWGFGRLDVVNLYALRATDPAALRKVADPIGPLNDQRILEAAATADQIVAAWGVFGDTRVRANYVRELLVSRGRTVYCLGVTNDGCPRHPLYLPRLTKTQLWCAPPLAPTGAGV
jgi:hypothetical protein